MRRAVPALIVITDREVAARARRPVRDVVAAAVDAGAPAVLLRDKNLEPAARRRLGEQIAPVVTRAGARLLVASDPWLARHLGADGIHLAVGDAHPGSQAAGMWVGRSCHDAHEVEAAVQERADLLLVSPVAPTASKPGYGPVLGADGCRQLVVRAGGLPVLALGGVTPENVSMWRDAGAHGLAVMGGVMASPDPAEFIRRLLDTWELP